MTDRNDVLATIRQVFSDGRPRNRDKAIRDVSRALGYRRAGSQIRSTLHADLLTAVRRGILANDRGELRLLCRSIDQYERDHLVEMLVAAMGSAWQTREEAMTAAARHLGFLRTGSNIRSAFKSAINAAIRRGLVERDGQELIRKVRR